MATLDMDGPFDLTSETIGRKVTRISIGNYALGYDKEGTFYVKYIGRSDNDVKKRLNSWIGKYRQFKFSYANSAKEAFEKECINYHDFGENKNLDNENHPDRPEDSGWKCPRCRIFD